MTLHRRTALAWLLAAGPGLGAAQPAGTPPNNPASPVPLATLDPATRIAQARRSHALGLPGAAIWQGRQALREAAPADPDGPAWATELAGWLADAGRLDEARAMREHARAATLAVFMDSPALTAASVAALADRAEDLAWAAAFPPGLAADFADLAAQTAAQPRMRRLPAPARPQAASGVLKLHAIGRPAGLSLLLDDGRSVTARTIDWPQAQREHELAATLALLAEPPARRPAEAEATLLRTLYRRFGAAVDDAARQAGAQEIELHAGGLLRALPWSVLLGPEAYLGERWPIRLAPAAPAANPPPAGPARAAWRLQALGLSRQVAGLPALPGVVGEVCGIVAGPVHGLTLGTQACGPGVVEGEGWLDEAFTADRLVAALSQPAAGTQGLLHLGTHFDLRPGRMARSALLLGDGTRWPLAQVAALDFSAQTLVTLAACETGESGGDAADSLQDLILRQGARAVLASRWRVDDASTAALMQAFYRALRSAPPSQALQKAQAAVRGRPAWRAPFHWAGFVLAGSA